MPESRALAVHFVAVNVIRQAIKLSAVLVLLIPAAARAECAAVTVPRLLNGPFAAPLVFRGTVRDVEKPTNQPLFEMSPLESLRYGRATSGERLRSAK